MTKKTKLLMLLAVVLAGVIAIILSVSRHPETGEATVRLGAVLPMTGPYALLGEGEERGLKLAVKNLNATQDKYRFSLKVEDSKGEAATGVSGAQRLTDLEDIEFMFTSLTPVSQAVGPIVADRNGLLIIFGMDESMADAGRGILRVYPGIREEGRQILDVVKRLSAEKVAILSFQHAAIDAQVDEVLIPGLNELGKEVLAERFQTVDDATLKSIISKIRNFSPNLLVANAYYSQLPAVLRSLREGGISSDTPIIGGLNLAIALSSESLSPEMKKGLFLAIPKYVYDSGSGSDSAARAFEQLYTGTYQDDATYDSAYAYDAATLLGESIVSVGPSPQDTLKEILNRRGFDGAVGALHLDNSGSSVSHWLSVKFENGKFILLN